MTQTCVDEVAGKASVVAHIGEISTRETIRLGKQVAALGVNAVSVITLYFVPLKQSELIAHYRAVAERAGCARVPLQHPGPHRQYA